MISISTIGITSTTTPTDIPIITAATEMYNVQMGSHFLTLVNVLP